MPRPLALAALLPLAACDSYRAGYVVGLVGVLVLFLVMTMLEGRD